MSATLIVLWALVGWCGTEIRPGPIPTPTRRTTLTGLLVCERCLAYWTVSSAAWSTRRCFAAGPSSFQIRLYAAATSVGAFVLARVASDTYGQVFNRPR